MSTPTPADALRWEKDVPIARVYIMKPYGMHLLGGLRLIDPKHYEAGTSARAIPRRELVWGKGYSLRFSGRRTTHSTSAFLKTG
jgi:hypothetical protein